MVFATGGCLMQKWTNAESSLKSFLHKFGFALSDQLLLVVTMASYLMIAQDRFNGIQPQANMI